MPQVSEKRLIIEWFLDRIGRIAKTRGLWSFLKKQVGQGMKSLLNAAEAEGEERNSSSSFNLSITVTDTTTTSLLSDKSLQIPKQGSMVKCRRLRALELLRYLFQHRYLKVRKRLPKSGAWYHDVINRLPLNRFRHFFRMNPDSFLFILQKIENHAVFRNNS